MFVVIAFIIDMLALSAVFYCHCCVCVCLYYFAHGTNSLNFFRVFLKHSEFFQSVWFEFEENPPFYFLPSIIYTLIRLKKLIEGPGTHYCCY